MKDTLISIIGEYVPFDSLDGISQIDWVWVLSAVLLIVCVYSVFRIFGGLIFGLFKD